MSEPLVRNELAGMAVAKLAESLARISDLERERDAYKICLQQLAALPEGGSARACLAQISGGVK